MQKRRINPLCVGSVSSSLSKPNQGKSTKKGGWEKRVRNSVNGPLSASAREGSGRKRFQREAMGELLDLEHLRSEMRRYPDMYVEEFGEKLRHFEAQLALLAVNPSKDSKEMTQLIGFICAT